MTNGASFPGHFLPLAAFPARHAFSCPVEFLCRWLPGCSMGSFIAKIAYTLFLCAYLGVLLPAHGHADDRDHAGCTICLAQAQPAESVPAFTLTVVSIRIGRRALPPPLPAVGEFSPVYQSRAPPAPFASL
jgi:hypothetical protein